MGADLVELLGAAARGCRPSTWCGGRRSRRSECALGVRQHRLADGGALRGLAAADPGRNRGDHPVADLLQVHHVGTVEHGEVHHQTGRAMQFVEQRGGGAVQAILVHGKRTQLDEAHAQFVVPAVASEPSQRDQPFQHAVGGRAGQPGASHELREGEPARAVERFQDQRHPIDDGSGGGGFRAFRGHGHGASLRRQSHMTISNIAICSIRVWRCHSRHACRGNAETPRRSSRRGVVRFESCQPLAAARPARRP